MFILHFDDRVDGGPRNVGPFDSREEAFAHGSEVANKNPDVIHSFEAWPVTAPGDDR